MEQPSQPQPTPPQEESIFTEEDFSMRDYNKHIRNARIMLFVMAALQLLPILWVATLNNVEEIYKWITVGIYGFIAALFVGFGFWAKVSPYPALLTAIIVYVGILVLFAIINPATIVQGLILKIIAIVLLIMGIRNAKEARDLKRAYGK